MQFVLLLLLAGCRWCSAQTSAKISTTNLYRETKDQVSFTGPTTSVRIITCITKASDGSIWFGAYHGVYRYNGKKIKDLKK